MTIEKTTQAADPIKENKFYKIASDKTLTRRQMRDAMAQELTVADTVWELEADERRKERDHRLHRLANATRWSFTGFRFPKEVRQAIEKAEKYDRTEFNQVRSEFRAYQAFLLSEQQREQQRAVETRRLSARGFHRLGAHP